MSRRGLGVGITVLALAAMGLAICWLFSSTGVRGLCERIMGETPEAKATAYMRAVARGDENAALNVWQLPDLQDQKQLEALAERRQQVTSELIAARMGPEFVVLDTEWWTTCCEPSVTCDPRGAGGARMTVQLLDDAGLPIIYVLDIFVRDGSYWGAAAGYPLRHWALRDVYLAGEEPLYWRRVHQESIRYLDWVPGNGP